MTDTTSAAPTKPAVNNPGDLFSPLFSFAFHIAIRSRFSEKDRFCEDLSALKFRLSTYASSLSTQDTAKKAGARQEARVRGQQAPGFV